MRRLDGFAPANSRGASLLSERAQSRSPGESAAEAVKAYIRTNRARLAQDGELLALLLPERFASNHVSDFQRFVVEKLAAENTRLRAERDSLHHARERAAHLGEGVRHALLALVDARSFAEAIAVAQSSARAFGVDRAGICVEGEASAKSATGVRLIAAGTADVLLGPNGSAAVLGAGGHLLLGQGGAECKSLAAFRLRIADPAALYVVGAREQHRFDSGELIVGLAFFARALERAIRAWLDLPKL